MAKAKKKPVKKAAKAAKTKKSKPAAKKRTTKPAKRAAKPAKQAVPTEVKAETSLAQALGPSFIEDIESSLDAFPEPTLEQAIGGRDAVHVELGAKLASVRGDELQERAAIGSAIDSYMRLAVADGAAANVSAYAAQCPEFFWEGSGTNPPVYARVPDATHDEIARWFQMIVEGVRAYDARVGATPS